MEPSCLFCLEPIKDNLAPNPIGCQCKIHAHQPCFKKWFDEKEQIECPICHTVSVANRIVLDAIHVVYVNTDRAREIQDYAKRNEKCAAFCCFTLLGWAIGITILELAIHQ